MNKKHTALLFALGLAIGAQAQNQSAADSVAAPANPQAAPIAQAETATAHVDTSASTPKENAGGNEVVADASADTPADTANPDSASSLPEATVQTDVKAQPAETAASDSVPAASVAQAETATAPDDTAASKSTENAGENEVAADASADTPADAAKPDSASSLPEATAQADVKAQPTETATSDSVQAAQAETASTHILDVLHGNAYNNVGNEAASATVADNIYIPHKMRGSKFGYFEPIEEFGAVSFGNAATYFIAFDNNDSLGLLTVGAAFGRFGASLETAIGRNWAALEFAGSESKSSTTDKGSLVGATFSAKVANLDLAVKGRFSYPAINVYNEAPNITSEYDSWDIQGKAIVSKSDNSKFAWTAAVNVLRHDAQLESNVTIDDIVDGNTVQINQKTTVTDSSSHVEIIPEFNIGSTVLESENARIHIGLNMVAPILIYDEIDLVRDKENVFKLLFTPNIFGEIALGNYVAAFAGASYQWNACSYNAFELDDSEIRSLEIHSGATTVSLGARFQYKNAALEMVFNDMFLSNPFGAFSYKQDIAASIGAFIMF